ncbi:MAG: hydroxymethylbilane synthase [Acidimicrobiales bacterium]
MSPSDQVAPDGGRDLGMATRGRGLVLATRGSELARWQADRVAALLRAAHPGLSVSLLEVETAGDRRADVPITDLAGQGVFVKEVQAAVLDGRADLAVHSAKDLPSTTPPGLVLACTPERADFRDALVGSTLARLPAGALVATGSVRRRAQLAWLRPDVTFTGLRGNIATRLAKAGPDRVVVVAAAALARLGLLARADEILAPEILLPQVAQGALAVECRVDDAAARAALAAIDDLTAHRAVAAERGFLRRLGGGCDLPVGALATVIDGDISIEGMLASPDGHVLLRARRVGGGEPAALGEVLAEELLAAGGDELLGRGESARS